MTDRRFVDLHTHSTASDGTLSPAEVVARADAAQLAAFALTASHFRAWLTDSGWGSRLGEAFFLPDYVDWKFALMIVIGLMCLWYLAATWNEVKRKLVVI